MRHYNNIRQKRMRRWRRVNAYAWYRLLRATRAKQFCKNEIICINTLFFFCGETLCPLPSASHTPAHLCHFFVNKRTWMFCHFTDFSSRSPDKSAYWHAVTHTRAAQSGTWSETRMCDIYTCARALIAYAICEAQFVPRSTSHFQVSACVCVCQLNVSITTKAGAAMSYGYRCRRTRARMIKSFKKVSLHASDRKHGSLLLFLV